MPEFSIRLEFEVEVDDPSYIDAAFAAAEWLQIAMTDPGFSYLEYKVAPFTGSRPADADYKSVDLEDVQSVDEPDPLPNIGDTCCGKCPGATCYVDQITGA